MWYDLLVALSLMMVIEGILPFVSPGQLRRTLLMLAQMDDGVLRFGGLTTMLLGVGLLYLVN